MGNQQSRGRPVEVMTRPVEDTRIAIKSRDDDQEGQAASRGRSEHGESGPGRVKVAQNTATLPQHAATRDTKTPNT